jgi:biotin carboxylase
MRLLFQKAGVNSPRFERHWVCEDPHAIAAKVRYPVVLKPIYLSGSRGVIRADTQGDFVNAFQRISRLLEQPGTGPDPKSLLVEEYIPGVEVSLEGVLTNGKIWPLGLYDKPDPLEGPFFEETILVTPSRLPAEAQQEIIRCAADALQAVGLTVGPFQVELRWNERGPWVVEFAARTLGGHCSRALPFEGGLTLEELVLSNAAGLDTSRFVRTKGAHGVMMIPIPGEGILRSVGGISEAEAIHGVSGVMITLPLGAPVTPLPDGDKHLAYILAHGENPPDVETVLGVFSVSKNESHVFVTFW